MLSQIQSRLRSLLTVAFLSFFFTFLCFSSSFSLGSGTAWAGESCGNGLPEGGEECDPGGQLYISGDPTLAPCATGDDCYYANTCCKFNCQYVGQGNVCSDGDACTGEDKCNQTGVCLSEVNSPDGTSCDDGLYCNGTEVCTDGICGSPTGDPCEGTPCNTCQEDTDSCFDPAGTGCNVDLECLSGECDGAGTCVGIPTSDPCDDGVWCNGTDTCSQGTCSVHAGDPCSEGAECANLCNEPADNCLAPSGTPCADDGNICTDNACDGDGACAATNNSVPCDDGVFCNGADMCLEGGCNAHQGDPCADGVACTIDTCREQSGTCDHMPAPALCDDLLFCNGNEGCDAQQGCVAGAVPCDDGNSCTDDLCTEQDDTCSHAPIADEQACNDANECTIDDRCAGGTCTGSSTLLAELCPWSIVVCADERTGLVKTVDGEHIEGDICASQLVLGYHPVHDGNDVAVKATGRRAMKIGMEAEIAGDIVTGGGGIRGKRSRTLPYTDQLFLDSGTVMEKSGDAGVYDLTGTHPLVDACASARQSFGDAGAALMLLGADWNAGAVDLNVADQVMELVALRPGDVNVIDVDYVRALGSTSLVLDGAGDPATTIVLRVAGRFLLMPGSSLRLAGGLTPDRLLIFVRGGRCAIGSGSTGAGTLLCTAAAIKTGYNVAWTGAWLAGGRLARISRRSVLNYEPFQAF